MAEELTDYLNEKNIKVAYIHSDIGALERMEILHKLRLGKFDVLVGINLLREGLDLPEVSLIGILDADKEGFLRSKTSLVQTMGRAARHIQGRVIMYADVMTGSMQSAIAETKERRKLQEEYNQKHEITPKSVEKSVAPEIKEQEIKLSAIDREFKKMPKNEKLHVIRELKLTMEKAASDLAFERAAEIRDQIAALEQNLIKT
jgi:excinuclease ABC subunit B